MTKIEAIQSRVYEILVEFDRICRKHDLKYSLEGGSMLGAIKYQSFVPWDDDIDVIMLRADYEKFLQIAPSELGELFFLQSQRNVADFPLNYAKLCRNDSCILDYAYSHITDMNHGLFIDIFPIDNCRTAMAPIQRKLLGVVTSSRAKKLGLDCGSGWKTIPRTVISWLPLKMLNRWIYRICTAFDGRSTPYRYEVCNSTERHHPLPSHIYDELVLVPFCDGEFYVVKEYDAFLKSRFGADYMTTLPPEKERKLSHFHTIVIDGKRYEDE